VRDGRARAMAVASHCRLSGARQRELGARVAAADCEFGAVFGAPRPRTPQTLLHRAGQGTVKAPKAFQ
jgi:hypothetical protein